MSNPRRTVRRQLALLLQTDASAVPNGVISRVLAFEDEDALRQHVLDLATTSDAHADRKTLEVAAKFFAKDVMRLPRTNSDDVTQEEESVVCGCMARDHDYRVNCCFCGYISCAVETSLECPHCGCGLGREAYCAARSVGDDEAFVAALTTRDRILQYDMQSTERTKVLDQATDWFEEAVDPWNTREEREFASGVHDTLQGRLSDAEGKTFVNIDFTNKKITEHDRLAELNKEALDELAVFVDLKRKNKPRPAPRSVDADDVYSGSLRRLTALTRNNAERAAALGAATRDLRQKKLVSHWGKRYAAC